MLYKSEQRRNMKLHTLPHYSETQFKQAQVVFGHDRPGLTWEYSDRFPLWDYDKDIAATATADESGKTKRSAEWYEAYLGAYYDKPVHLECVMAGVNMSTGYPYAVFGFTCQ